MGDKTAGSSLVVVHRCEKCGHAARANQLNDDSTVSGIFICPTCGHPGPLHPEVVSQSELLENEGRSIANTLVGQLEAVLRR